MSDNAEIMRRLLALERENRDLRKSLERLRDRQRRIPGGYPRTAVLQAVSTIAGRTGPTSGEYDISHGPARLYDLIRPASGAWKLKQVAGTSTAPNVELGNLWDDELAADEFLFGVQVGGQWLQVGGAATAAPDTGPTNPGVVRVVIVGESNCADEKSAPTDVVYEATVSSRPAYSGDELPRENGGTIILHDPSGCMADLDTADLIGLNFWASLMQGGEAFDWGFNFRATELFVTDGAQEIFVPTSASYPTTHDDYCWEYGWDSSVSATDDEATADRRIAGHHHGNATFKVDLPERGTYEIQLAAGNHDVASKATITLYDGTDVISTIVQNLDAGEFVDVDGAVSVGTYSGATLEHDFQSSGRPQFKVQIEYDSAEELYTYLCHVRITQTGEVTRWEAINRCCSPADLE